MSLIGKQPITIPEGVDVTINDGLITAKGSKGELQYQLLPQAKMIIDNGIIKVGRMDDSKEARSIHGLTRALLNNMIIGVSKGFEKRLEIIGVGYRAQTSGNKITLHLGFSHPIEYEAIEGVKIEMDQDNKNIIVVSGIDKQKVGEVAANIRKFRPPEPYKGKGVRYVDEYVRRKAGKAAAKSS